MTRRRPAQPVAGWQRHKSPLVAVMLVFLLVAWESAGGPVAISARYAEQLTSGKLARNIAYSSGRFLHDVMMALITRAR
jgi:hypothetical protein